MGEEKGISPFEKGGLRGILKSISHNSNIEQ
jgi:hypothetical protein